MPKFLVSFNISGEIDVDCDDADDARGYVECMDAEQMVWWCCRQQLATLNKEVIVQSVTSTS